MRDVELYRHLLGLEEPWTVRSVELNARGNGSTCGPVHAGDVRWPCPECGAGLALYDHAEERVWRHLDSCQFMTYLHAQPPPVECPTHGVRQMRLPWAEARARFTTLFERLAIDVLKETDIRGATRILRISWDEVWHSALEVPLALRDGGSAGAASGVVRPTQGHHPQDRPRLGYQGKPA